MALDNAVEEKLSEKTVARMMKLPYPVEKVRKTPAQIKAMIAKETRAEVLKEYPEGLNRDHEKEASAGINLQEIGANVTVSLINGTDVTGRLNNIQIKTVRIGLHELAKDMITIESLATIDPQVRKTLIAKLVRISKHKDKLRIGMVRERVRKHRKPILYRRYGYVRVKGKWISQAQLLERGLKRQRLILRRKLKAKVIRKVMTENKYVLVQGKWMPGTPAVVVEKPKPTEPTTGTNTLKPPPAGHLLPNIPGTNIPVIQKPVEPPGKEPVKPSKTPDDVKEPKPADETPIDAPPISPDEEFFQPVPGTEE